jgi:hypothetical protein
MAQEPLSTFHEHLLLFIQEELQKKKNFMGWDEVIDSDLCSFRDTLSRAIRGSLPARLDELLECYQELSMRGPIHLDHKLLEAFPQLRMGRGLPRLYKRDQPAISKLKRHFSDLPSLKRTIAAKSIYACYRSRPVPIDARISLLTRVMADGWGDYYAALRTAILIRRAFPFLEIHLFAIAERTLPKGQTSLGTVAIQPWTASQDQLRCLRSSDLILEIPTVHPERDEWKQKMEALDDPRPLPKWESVGEYGFKESEWFHPETRNHSMGLHFLEKGILIREPLSVPSVIQFENHSIAEWFNHERHFYLAYLYSDAGMFIYLHALLKSLEQDERDIDICLPDEGAFLQFLRGRVGKGILEKNYQVRRIVIQTREHVTILELAKTGKELRLISSGPLSQHDFQVLLHLSEDFAACRGDQSFSDVVSQDRGFFYDPRDHSRYFLKDLIALAENRIASHRSTLGILRLFAKVLEKNLPQGEGEWVDEIELQREESMSLIEIAEAMGSYLQDPDAIVGFKKINQILRDETSCNAFLIHLVQRAVCHRRHPHIGLLEEEELLSFAHNQKSLSQLLVNLKQALR